MAPLNKAVINNPATPGEFSNASTTKYARTCHKH